jgi:hypothetical protein
MENITLLRSTKEYSALQTKLALMDMILNKDGFDPNLWSVYKPGAKYSDLHSLTGFNTFVGSIKKKVIEIETETGEKYAFLPNQKIKVWRGKIVKEGDHIEDDHKLLNVGEKIPEEIMGADIKETDEFLSYH